MSQGKELPFVEHLSYARPDAGTILATPRSSPMRLGLSFPPCR